MALRLGRKFWVFFYIEYFALFQIGVRQVSFFSGAQIFESEFRASLLPSRCLSTHSPVPSWGQGATGCPEPRLVAWLLGLAASKHSTALGFILPSVGRTSVFQTWRPEHSPGCPEIDTFPGGSLGLLGPWVSFS